MHNMGAIKKDILEKRGNRVIFAPGGCHAIVIVERIEDHRRGNPLIELWVEDDENWFLKAAFDAYWLAPLIEALTTASKDAHIKNIPFPWRKRPRQKRKAAL